MLAVDEVPVALITTVGALIGTAMTGLVTWITVSRRTEPLRPNGGLSLADKVDALAADVAAARPILAEMPAAHDMLRRLQLDTAASVGALHERVETLGAAQAELDGKLGELTVKLTDVAGDVRGHREWHRERETA